MNIRYYIGIDVSKITLDLAVYTNQRIVWQTQSENAPTPIRAVLKQLQSLPGFNHSTCMVCPVTGSSIFILAPFCSADQDLGATVLRVWALLAKGFVGLVVLGCFLASPIAWYFLHDWLQSYSYRTPISGWIFVGLGVGALLLSLVTVSYQSIKAALMNPVKSLRSE